MVKSPIHNFHLENNAKFKQYGYWEMPASYSSFEEEYDVLRENIGLIDSSCMTKIKIKGNNAEEWLNELCTGNVLALSTGKSINTAICRENGSIVAIIWLLKDEDAYWVLTDAENREKLIEWLNQRKTSGIIVTDISQNFACFSVIGPKGIEIPKILCGEDIIGLSYLHFMVCKLPDLDREVILYRAGYTGEYEYRFLVPVDSAEVLWKKILDQGKELDLKICGLEILNPLMLEMKSINQQKDIRETTTLLQAGLHWMIYFRKEKFIGKDAIISEKLRGVTPKALLCTFESDFKINENSPVFLFEKKIGEVVHIEYSPKISKQIGLAYISAEYAWVGLEFEVVNIDNKKIKTHTVSAPLFLTKTVIGLRE